MALNPRPGAKSRTHAHFRDQDIVERDHQINSEESSESSNELDLVDPASEDPNKHFADHVDPNSEDLPPMAPSLIRQAAFINVATSSPFRSHPSLAA